MNKTITLSSGKQFEMSMQSFAIGSAMFKVLSKELKGVDIKGDFDLNLKAILSGSFKVSDEQMNFLKNIFFTIASCEDFESLIFECFKKCLYDTTKQVNASLFDVNQEARSDYLEMAWEVAKFNLSPFFKNLALILKA